MELSDDPDPTDALAAVAAVAGSSDLVVDRTGTPLRGAVVGRDLLTGDRLVGPTDRTAPALCALTGPLRGTRAVLDRELLLGRGGRLGDRTVHDTEVSRHHLRVTPTPGGLAATDIGSTNGTLLNDRPLSGTAVLRAGDRLEVGASVLVVLGDPPRRAHLRSRDGAVVLTVPPPGAGAATGATGGDGEEGPTDGVDRSAGPPTGSRRRWRRGRRAPVPATTDRTDPTVGAPADHEVRHDRHPDPAVVAATIAGWSDGLWARRPGHPGDGTVRIGELLADPRPSPTTGLDAPAAEATGAHATALAGSGRPWVLDLWAERAIGVVGAPDVTAEHVAAWLLHLAALQHPGHLSLSVLAAPGTGPLERLAAAARWLPHTGPGAAGAGRPPADRSVAFVEVAPDAPGGPLGGTTVWLARARRALPHPCPVVVELADDGSRATWRREGTPARRLGPDLVGGALVDDLARLLAPLVAVEAGSDHAR